MKYNAVGQRSHSLEGAKEIAQAFLDKRNQWSDIFGEGK